MSGISSKAAGGLENKYKFGGKEKQDNEFSNGVGLELYDFGARQNDPQIGRWTSVDPLADKFSHQSPYVAMDNNPINIIDPTGMSGTSTHTDKDGKVLAVYNDGDLGVYKHENAKTKSDIDRTYLDTYDASNHADKSGGGEKMGKTLEWNSFLFEGDGDPTGTIDFGSSEALQSIMQVLYKVDNSFSNDAPLGDILSLAEYMFNGTGGKKYDIKKIGGSDPQNMYRGSLISEGTYVSARDAGNFIAGRVAAKYHIGYSIAAVAFGALNLAGNKGVEEMILKMPAAAALGERNYFGEKQISHAFQKRGFFDLKN
jgi:RHS repeat-associated protein